MSYINLHEHTEFSLLDGAARIKDLVARAKELDMDALAITDHGNMFGVIKFYKECKKQGIKPIIGCEVYTAERNKEDKEVDKDKVIGHLILLCKDSVGYQNLLKIVSDAYTDGFYYKPRTDKAALREYHEGLICLSGCLAGKIQRLLVNKKYKDAKREALEMQEIFGEGNFYLELQDHGYPEDRMVIEGLLKISKETGIPVVATNDTHYVYKEDARAQELLMCLQTQSTISDPKHMSFQTDEFYLKSDDEMRKLFPYIPEALENTRKIAEKCNLEIEFGHYRIPSYDVPAPYTDSFEYFKYICTEGFEKKYPDKPKELQDRLEYEVNTIKDMGFVEYFLIVWDYINWAKAQGILVGPGRGSAAGSIVAYSMGITDIDPIKNDLIFERFLNPQRVSMPDIDVDFEVRRRQEVKDYVAQKYGEDCVCQISTFGTLKAKMAVRDVARALDVPYAKANNLAKLIPDEKDITLMTALELEPELKKLYNADPEVHEVIDMASKLEDIPRHVSTHAAGVVISSEPIKDHIPLVSGDKGVATQYNMVEIEELGMLKMDFLGLRNLSAIEDTLKMVKRNTGKEIDLSKLNYSDENVYKMISQGKTVGVFQLESKGITDFMKKLRPSCFEDIVAGIALYRPGPMDSIPTYIANKKNPHKIKYIDDHLAPILDVTYGCIVYQEQVMRIVRDLAGYSFGRADIVRKAMSKKKKDIMDIEREYFINGKVDEDGNVEIPGCVRNGIPKEAAEKIFDDMESFAQYAFNKSHAAAYAVITYQTAWLRCYYPSEFMAALMTSEKGNSDHLAVFIEDAKKITVPGTRRKIKVLPPDVMESLSSFNATLDGNIRYGMAAVKYVGEEVAKSIEEMNKEGLDGDLSEFFRRVPKNSLKSKSFLALMSVGAFHDFVPTIATGLAHVDEFIKRARDDSSRSGQLSIFDTHREVANVVMPKVKALPELSEDVLLEYEKEYLGCYLTGHPLNKYADLIKTHIDATASDIEKPSNIGNVVVVAGVVSEVKKIFTKKGDRMAFVLINAMDGAINVVVFPKVFEKREGNLIENKAIAIKGKIDDASQILADDIVPLEEVAFLSHKKAEKSPRYLKLRTDVTPELVSVLHDANEGSTRVLIYKPNGETLQYNKKIKKENYLDARLRSIIGADNVKWD